MYVWALHLLRFVGEKLNALSDSEDNVAYKHKSFLGKSSDFSKQKKILVCRQAIINLLYLLEIVPYIKRE